MQPDPPRYTCYICPVKTFKGTLKSAETPREMTLEELSDLFAEWEEPRYRAKQVFKWMHHQGLLDAASMTNLPVSLRTKLQEAGLKADVHVADVHTSLDGTHKLVLAMGDGARVETVLIPQAKEEDAYTQCLSTQVGCAMGCGFCASGVAGLKRHLSASEILAQVHLAKTWLKEKSRESSVENYVFMGMGEPLHNYDALVRSLVLMNHEDGLNNSLRRITVSTSGLVPQLDKLGKDFEGQVPLAISLHAVSDDKRTALMPINKTHNISALIASLKRYPKPARQRFTIEYTLIKGVNDALTEADALAKLLKPLAVKVNLIPMNPIEASPWQPPPWSHVEAFQARLQSHHLSVFVRKKRGDDVAAACGQLALHGAEPKARRRAPLPLLDD